MVQCNLNTYIHMTSLYYYYNKGIQSAFLATKIFKKKQKIQKLGQQAIYFASVCVINTTGIQIVMVSDQN